MGEEENTSNANQLPTTTLEWNDVLRALGSIAGFIGITGALLWLFGRFYFSGVFSAFTFPSLSITLSPEDYLERGAPQFVSLLIDVLISIFIYYLAYLAKTLYHERINKLIKNRIVKTTYILLIFLVSIVGGVFLISTEKLGISASFFFEDANNLVGIFLLFLGLEVTFLIASPLNDIEGQAQNMLVISHQTPIAIVRILIIIVMFASFLFTHAWSSFTNGQVAGCLKVSRKSTSVEIFSRDSILLEGQSQTGDLYKYDGYFLLFVDNSNYYLFRETDPITYKPQSYFVLNKDVLKSIQITDLSVPEDENDKLSSSCTEKYK